MLALKIMGREEKNILRQKRRFYVMTSSDTFHYNTLHVSCNNFRVYHSPPGGNTFDTVEARYHVKDLAEAEVIYYEGGREAVKRDSVASSGFPNMTYASRLLRIEMNTYKLVSLRAHIV